MHRCKDNWIKLAFFVFLVVGFEVDEVDSHVMRSVNGLCKLQLVSDHVWINSVATTKLTKSISYMHVDI